MDAAVPALADLFPEGDFRLHLTLRRGDPRDFFAPRDGSSDVLVERARWVEQDRARYATMTAEGLPLLQEWASLARAWGIPNLVDVAELGRTFDCDVLMLSRDDAGEFRLRGGALCFPTGWALEDKLGLTLDEIHGVVPGLNPTLGSPIRQFLGRLKPGLAYFRDNWGLAATDELNLHPARAIPGPLPPVSLDRLWLRVEHQALVALPQTGGIVFGIRIALHRLDQVARTDAAVGLRNALATMPSELAAYKRLDSIRTDVVRMLASATAE